MAKSRKFKGSSLKRGNMLEMYGVSELLKKIEAAGGKVDAACIKAANKSMRVVGEHSQAFMSRHEGTGDTKKSYQQTPAKVEGGKIVASVGYNIDDGGLPAIFLDVGAPNRKTTVGHRAGKGVTGTPKMNPQKGLYWRYYAVNDSGQVKKITDAQHAALNEIMEGLKQ